MELSSDGVDSGWFNSLSLWVELGHNGEGRTFTKEYLMKYDLKFFLKNHMARLAETFVEASFCSVSGFIACVMSLITAF